MISTTQEMMFAKSSMSSGGRKEALTKVGESIKASKRGVKKVFFIRFGLCLLVLVLF